MELSLDQLAEFLVRARRHGYAGDAEKTATPQRPGFKEFAPYVEGNLEYVDSYAGYYYAPGQEVVRENGVPVWMMAYSGGMLPAHHGDKRLASETFAFLKSVLLKARPSTPFRGPPFIQGNKFTYIDLSDGDLSQFHGHERIFYRGEVVFRQDYVGGLVVPKDPKAVSVK